jgi:hypothetical protein
MAYWRSFAPLFDRLPWIVGSLDRWTVGPLDRWTVGSLEIDPPAELNQHEALTIHVAYWAFRVDLANAWSIS